MTDEQIEQEIQEKGLTAPRVTKELIESKIEHVGYATYLTPTGSVLRWCCITMSNGFTVTGRPSASVSPENDDEEIGRKIAYDNAYDKIWELEGYLLADKLNNE